LMSVVSRKVHGGGTGTFDINLPLPPMSSPRGVECRSGGTNNDYTLVFTFKNNLTSVTGASVSGHDPSNGTGTVSSNSMGPGANQYTVHLTNVSTGQYIKVTLNGVLDAAGNNGDVLSPQMGVLVGDVDATGRVDGNDVSTVQSHTRQTTNGTNFRDDIDETGRIEGNDVSATQAHTRTGLPSSP
jgi:hypothetical protein